MYTPIKAIPTFTVHSTAVAKMLIILLSNNLRSIKQGVKEKKGAKRPCRISGCRVRLAYMPHRRW